MQLDEQRAKRSLSDLKILALFQLHVHHANMRKDTRLSARICVPERGNLGMKLLLDPFHPHCYGL